MIHDPCCVADTKARYMKAGWCSKDFPKKFQTRIILNKSGFVYYKLRDLQGSFVIKNGI
jgi:hypothetical protein